jgi:hypothetical protein
MDSFLVDPGVPEPDVPDNVRAAACRAYGDWLTDIALRPDVRILDDLGLLRSAELLDGAYSGEEVAAEIERLLIDEDGDQTAALARLAEGDWGGRARETAAAYLDDRGKDPSAEAADRCVIYMVPTTIDSVVTVAQVLIVRLEINPDAE